MAYRDFKDLTKIKASDKILRDKTFNIFKYPKYDGYQRGFTSMVYKSFDKKSASLARSETLDTRDKSAFSGAVKNENMTNQESAEELHKPII